MVLTPASSNIAPRLRLITEYLSIRGPSYERVTCLVVAAFLYPRHTLPTLNYVLTSVADYATLERERALFSQLGDITCSPLEASLSSPS